MSRETEIETLLEADATLMSTLSGGIYTSGAVGEAGITRETTPNAFEDPSGFLLPCALVRERDRVGDGQIADDIAQIDSDIQIVEVWVYEDSGYSNIDTAMDRIYTVLRGVMLSDTFPLRLASQIKRQRDNGALMGRPVERQDWQTNSVRGI